MVKHQLQVRCLRSVPLGSWNTKELLQLSAYTKETEIYMMEKSLQYNGEKTLKRLRWCRENWRVPYKGSKLEHSLIPFAKIN